MTICFGDCPVIHLTSAIGRLWHIAAIHYFNLEIIPARKKAGLDDHTAEGLEHGGQDTAVAEAAEEFDKTIKFNSLTLSKNPGVDAIFKACCAQKRITDPALLTSTSLEKPP